MLSRQRSGTQLLMNLLKGHHELSATGEVFHEVWKEKENGFYRFIVEHFDNNLIEFVNAKSNPSLLLDEYFSYVLQKSFSKNVLVDVKYNSLHHIDPFWNDILSEPYLLRVIRERELKVVHLIRDNYLANYASSLLARKNFNWSAFESKRQHTTIEIDTSTLVNEISKREREIEYIQDFFKLSSHYTEIRYEDILDNEGSFNVDTQEKIMSFLGLSGSHFNKKPQTTKAARSLHELIDNFNDVSDLLARTKYEWMLKG